MFHIIRPIISSFHLSKLSMFIYKNSSAKIHPPHHVVPLKLSSPHVLIFRK